MGTVELSLSASSRSVFLLINPPKDAAYVSNIAVAPEFRRQGHASRLLKAAEQIVRSTPIKDIYLHLLCNLTSLRSYILSCVRQGER